MVPADLFTEYSSNASMHGVKFIGEKDRSVAERLFWIVAFVLSMVLLGWMTFDIWLKWRTSPVIISNAKKPVSVWDIPFPAVTICPEPKVDFAYLNFTSAYNRLKNDSESLTEEELMYLEASSQLCDPHVFESQNFSSGLKASTIGSVIKKIGVTVDVVDYILWGEEAQSFDAFTGQKNIFET